MLFMRACCAPCYNKHKRPYRRIITQGCRRDRGRRRKDSGAAIFWRLERGVFSATERKKNSPRFSRTLVVVFLKKWRVVLTTDRFNYSISQCSVVVFLKKWRVVLTTDRFNYSISQCSVVDLPLQVGDRCGALLTLGRVLASRGLGAAFFILPGCVPDD
jgi:hypothetical protein